MDIPETPTLDRISKLKDESQALGEFLDWLSNERGVYWMRRVHVHDDVEVPAGDATGCMRMGKERDLWHRCEEISADVSQSAERWLAEFYQIDLREVDKEKDFILEYMRSQNDARAQTDSKS